MAVIQGQNLVVVSWPLADHRRQIMKILTSAQLFAPPKKARKTKARLDRAKLVIVKAARARGSNDAAICGRSLQRCAQCALPPCCRDNAWLMRG
jgi:hypothetical protein